MSKIKQRLMALGKILLVFLGIVIFPLGLFMLGYIIGVNKNSKPKFTTKPETPSTIVQKIVDEEKIVL